MPYGWIRLSPIVQDSSLLPLKNVWAVSSVPVWLIVLSDQLGIFGLVKQLTYQLPNPT